MIEVGVAQLRRELKDWIDRAASGEDVVITDRGRPVVRLSSIAEAPLLERLEAEGVVTSPATTERPRATGRPLVEVDGSPLRDAVVADRDARR